MHFTFICIVVKKLKIKSQKVKQDPAMYVYYNPGTGTWQAVTRVNGKFEVTLGYTVGPFLKKTHNKVSLEFWITMCMATQNITC